MTGWTIPPFPWSAYSALMTCRLVALDERPDLRLVGIGDTLCRALAKLDMRAAWDQAKTACGNLQLCSVLDSGIKGAAHAVGQKRLVRSSVKWNEEEARRTK